jgi:hypothetical protein
MIYIIKLDPDSDCQEIHNRTVKSSQLEWAGDYVHVHLEGWKCYTLDKADVVPITDTFTPPKSCSDDYKEGWSDCIRMITPYFSHNN